MENAFLTLFIYLVQYMDLEILMPLLVIDTSGNGWYYIVETYVET
ncbi:hypothetical protein SAMN05192559_11544 [Halobacillus karajensis]|nr:hypothetical protein SAMN05192559_11544 [Halobacillus karajensis]